MNNQKTIIIKEKSQIPNSKSQILQIFYIIFISLTILPFLILCFFNHPGPEDMSFAENTLREGFIKSQIALFKTAGGRFFHYALLGINPLIFHSITAYKFTIFFSMILFIYIFYLFLNEIFSKILSFKEKLLITLSVFFLYIYGMSSVSQGFYYLAGIALYNLSLILLMLIFIFYCRLENSDSKRSKLIYSTGIILLFVAITGSVELAIVLMGMSILFLSAYRIFKKKKLNPLLVIFIILFIAMALLIFFSPGNISRTDKYIYKHQFGYSLINSFTFTLSSVYFWILRTPIAGITVLLIPILFSVMKNEKKIKIFNVNPLLSLIISFAFLYSMSFVVYWGINMPPYDRILNFIYFVFLVIWFYNIGLILNYFSKKFSYNISKYAGYFYLTALIIIALFLFKKNNNIRVAYSELIRGTAVEYDSKMNDRYKTIYECKTDSCAIDSIKIVPKTLGEVELTNDPMDNFNRWYARFFHKKYIYVKNGPEH